MEKDSLSRRTGTDFSSYEMLHYETPQLMRHTLRQPDGLPPPKVSPVREVNFINLLQRNLVVTGGYGNWIFSRPFVPTADDTVVVSDRYWVEKLHCNSSQEPMHFDATLTEQRIHEALAQIDDDFNQGDRKNEWTAFLQDCLDHVQLSEFEYAAFAYMNFPSWTDAEAVPFAKSVDVRLRLIFDAFEEICRRLYHTQQQEESDG